MTKFLIKLGLIFLLVNCSQGNEIKKPTNLIDKDVFTNIIYDVSLLEGHMASYNLNQDVFKDSSRRMYKGIFDKYEITAIDFKENNDYYILNGEYSDMSKEVLEKILVEEAKYKDVKPFNTISSVQFNQLFKEDDFLEFFKSDTAFTNNEKLDSAIRFYRINSQKLDSSDIDSLNFELNIKNLKRNKNMFTNMFGVKKEMNLPINE